MCWKTPKGLRHIWFSTGRILWLLTLVFLHLLQRNIVISFSFLNDKSLQYQNVHIACTFSFLRCKGKNDNIFIASVWNIGLVVKEPDWRNSCLSNPFKVTLRRLSYKHGIDTIKPFNSFGHINHLFPMVAVDRIVQVTSFIRMAHVVGSAAPCLVVCMHMCLCVRMNIHISLLICHRQMWNSDWSGNLSFLPNNELTLNTNGRFWKGSGISNIKEFVQLSISRKMF